jgi:glycosyltransferase involved in cell wall biosynthesis
VESMIDTDGRHITVCVCTYKRRSLLVKLINGLQNQKSHGLFTYGMVVVDNDCAGSARQTVDDCKKKSSMSIRYLVEPEQNIAMARNKAIANAEGDFIAFIDDDEVPGDDWLNNLLHAYEKFGADGVLGPVLPYYDVNPPKWIINGKFYERPSHKTGEVLHWTNTRTGNVMVRMDIFNDGDNRFRREFGSGGEDRDFFRRMIEKGYRFVWCAEAPVYEAVTADRCRRSFMLRRALLRGQSPNIATVDILKSLCAVPLYTTMLPILFLFSHVYFMKYLIKACDHIGRIFCFCGIILVKDKYVIQ